jgi:hypothetical protein
VTFDNDSKCAADARLRYYLGCHEEMLMKVISLSTTANTTTAITATHNKLETLCSCSSDTLEHTQQRA